MELIISSCALALLLLVGAFADFLMAAWSPQDVYHGDAFPAEPHQVFVIDHRPEFVQNYDRAA